MRDAYRGTLCGRAGWRAIPRLEHPSRADAGCRWLPQWTHQATTASPALVNKKVTTVESESVQGPAVADCPAAALALEKLWIGAGHTIVWCGRTVRHTFNCARAAGVASIRSSFDHSPSRLPWLVGAEGCRPVEAAHGQASGLTDNRSSVDLGSRRSASPDPTRRAVC